MRVQVFWLLLVALGLATGCLLRQSVPVTKQKSLGKVLDELFVRGAKGVDVADEIGKVRSLLKKSAATALTEADIRQLAEAVMRGGSEVIDEFKAVTVSRANSLTNAKDLMDATMRRVKAAMAYLSPKQQKEFQQLSIDENFDGMTKFLKQHTSLGSDPIFKRHVELHGKNLDEVAEIFADQHLIADAVGKELKANTILSHIDHTADEIAAELKLGLMDTELLKFGEANSKTIRLVEEVTGVDLWREHAHLELLLRRADDNKPIYTKLSQKDIQLLGNPFDKDFKIPIAKLERRQGYYLNTLYQDGAYVNPAKDAQRNIAKYRGKTAEEQARELLQSVLDASN